MIRSIVFSIFILLCTNKINSQENKNIDDEFEILHQYMTTLQEFNKKSEFSRSKEFVVFDKTDEDLIKLYTSYWEKTETDTLVNGADSLGINSSFILHKKLKKKLFAEIKEDEPINWNDFQMPDKFRLVEYKKLPIQDNLKPFKRKIVLFISKPVIFENGTMAIFRAWEIDGIEISGTPTLQIYKKKSSRWEKFSEIAWVSF